MKYYYIIIHKMFKCKEISFATIKNKTCSFIVLGCVKLTMFVCLKISPFKYQINLLI